MRAALAIGLLLVVACTGPGHPSSQSPAASVKLSPGGVVEYPLPWQPACGGCVQVSPTSIAAGADGNLWFVDPISNVIGRITPSGAATKFEIPNPGGSLGNIAAGPDHNMWVAVNGGGQGRPDWILRIGPTGEFTKFQAGAGQVEGFGTGPTGIAPGSDGNIWFTEFWSNRIGRMTPSGQLTEFSISTPASQPRGIVAGPDGNLWFTESSRFHSAIARMTPSGAITEWVLHPDQPDFNPFSIVTGPDGNMWYSELGYLAHNSIPAGNIAKITPAGVITNYPLPSGSVATALAIGPDGNLWFTDPSRNSIGRMTTTGTYREFALPKRNSQPAGIAAGPSGRMWLTEGNRIASIGTTVPEVSLNTNVMKFGAGSSTRTLEITDTGDAVLAISKVKVIGPDEGAYRIAHDGCTGRVAAGASCNVDVTFTPAAGTGLRVARLTITDNATASPQSVSLSAQLDCTLPVFVETNSTAKGQFLNVADGGVVDAPGAGFTTQGTLSQSLAKPIFYGTLPATYDAPGHRWVPGALSPDGSRYAYVDYRQWPQTFTVHVVDVATGGDRTLPLPAGQWIVRGFTPDGIYLGRATEITLPGLWLANPDSGALRTVFTDMTVAWVSGQSAWIVARDNSDKLSGPPGIGPAYNEVLSRDLKTLRTTTWIYRSGFNLNVLAAGNSSIVVGGYDGNGFSLWVVSGPGQAAPVVVPGTDEGVPYSSGAFPDLGGWWLGSLDGIYLWTPRTGAVLVAETPAGPAGACA